MVGEWSWSGHANGPLCVLREEGAAKRALNPPPTLSNKENLTHHILDLDGLQFCIAYGTP